MSELTLFLIRLAYLAILWIFVLSAISVIRSDMFGARAPAPGRAGSRATGKPRRAASRRRSGAGSPTHVLVVDGANAGERADLDAGADPDRPRPDARSGSTTTTSPPGTPGSPPPATSGSSRTSAPPTAPTSAPPGITQPTTLTLGTQVRIGKTILELRK